MATSLPKYRSARLSKKVFMSLPAGGFLVSGVFDFASHPVFAEPVAPLQKREAQWVRIKELKVDQQHFTRYPNKAIYAKEYAKISPPSKSR